MGTKAKILPKNENTTAFKRLFVKKCFYFWAGVDGHHRLKICKKHSLAYKTVAYEFEYDEIDAKIWMVENQKNRRNLTDFCKVRLELVIKDLYLDRNKKIADAGR